MPLRVVSLDLDGTLVHPAAFNAAAKALGFADRLEATLQGYLDGSVSLQEAFHLDYGVFVGRDVTEVQDALWRSPDWTPGIQDAITAMQAAGLKVVVTTDQPDWIADVTRRFGVDDVLCSPTIPSACRITDEVDARFEKWPLLQEWLDEHGIGPDEVAHVGNGHNDVPIFERVDIGVAVNTVEDEIADAATFHLPRLADLGEVAALLLDRGTHPANEA